EYGGREAWLVLTQNHSPSVDTTSPSLDKMIVPVANFYALALFGIEFYRIVIFVDIFGYFRFTIRFPIHYLAPTTPVGIEVNKHFSRFFSIQFIGFLR